jgi:hypothetical protein
MIYKIENNPFIPLLEDYFKTEYNYTGSLDELHKILENLPTEKKQQCVKIFTIGKDDRQNIFIKNFHRFVDTSTMFETVYHTFVRKYIFPLFPEERQLVIQKTPNIRFSFPESAAIGKHEKEDKKNGIIGHHCDSDFGHHATEMNFIIPITKMFATNSVYYEPYPDSDVAITSYENLVLKPEEFFKAYFNKQRHYNRINQTNKTRISYDLRVIPYTKYMEHLADFKGTKFELGKYYIVL